MATTFGYEVIEGWEKLPAGYVHGNVQGVRVDSRDRVYVLTCWDPHLMIYERDGTFVTSWGENIFSSGVHGLELGPDGSVYITDAGDHTVRKFTPEGKLLMQIGTPGKPSDTGYVREKGLASITHGGPPFNRPTKVAIAKNGELYVSDGYGNARVHRFTADGKLIQSWGEPGTGPGQFSLPHGAYIAPDGRIIVCCREGDRIQFFSPDGQYLDQWTHVQRPTEVYIDKDGLVYISSLRWNVGEYSYLYGPIKRSLPGHISVFDLTGNLLLRWISEDGCAPGNFFVPHTMCVDSRGDLYVGEVGFTSGVKPGLIPPTCHTLQKFKRRGSPPRKV